MAQPVEIDFEEETLSELAEEEFPESFIEELGEDEIHAIEEPWTQKEEKVSIFHEEWRPPGASSSEEFELLRGFHSQEVRTFSSPEFSSEVGHDFVQEVHLQSREAEAPKTFLEEVQPQTGVFDRQMEEVIGKGVQEMMEGFITKVLPEMTQNILNLTVERIEKMVKEIVPDLAEKAIQEEIRRLQKGEKD